MTYCRCGHADVLHVDSFLLHGRQECDVNGCPCQQFEAAR